MPPHPNPERGAGSPAVLSQRPASRCASEGAMLADRVGSPPPSPGNYNLVVLPVYLAALRAGPGGAPHLYAPSSPGAAGAGTGWGGSEAGLSSPARAASPPQAEPPSPALSVSLPCSRRGRSDLQRSRGAGLDLLGAAPPGASDGGGRSAARGPGPLGSAR